MDKEILTFINDHELISLRDFLREKLSKKYYRNLKSSNAIILVNGTTLETYKNISKNDIITVEYIKEYNSNNWCFDKTPLIIYYEDSNYLVCFKKEGILTIPTKNDNYHSLYQQLLYYLRYDTSHISILNRLDKETSGLVLIAKNRYSAYLLQPVKEHIRRKYHAIVKGKVPLNLNIICNMDRSLDSNKRCITKNGKFSYTSLKVLKYIGDNTLCELELQTGRTHQIRLHLSSIGYPIIGDLMYGDITSNRLYLESMYLEYLCPFTKEKRIFEITEDFKIDK